MITECYIKGRFDYGKGKAAVVIVEDSTLLHKVAWKVPDEWEYDGEAIVADQYNCEILAACYALDWCMKNNKELVNIYANTKTAELWYGEQAFPQSRMAMGKAFYNAYDDFCAKMDAKKYVHRRVYGDYIPKDADSCWNRLVNDIAIKL
jgi:hypothetical protein